MIEAYWLLRRDAAAEAARAETCGEARLARFHDAGVFSVRARAAQVAADEA